MYYHFSEPVKKLAGHRVLAINRGEKEKILSVKLIAPEEQIVRYMEKQLIIRLDGDAARVMKEVILDSYRRLIGPAIEREIRAGLTETAENGAIQVFGKNMESAPDAAADRRMRGARLGSGIPDGLQAGSCG